MKSRADWQIIFAEPFRIFFPVGLLLGAVGVGLWPAFYGGLISAYPDISHARLMIEGFMASFIIGFLGTAGPRITSAPPFSRVEFAALLTLDLFGAGLHLGDANRAGDFTFVILVATFAVVLAKRFAQRADWPPPNFALVALGIVNGLAGGLLVALFESERYSAQYAIGAALLQQGFALLPIVGVAPFFIRRLLEIQTSEPTLEGRNVPPQWIRNALFALAVGLTIDATFVAEGLGSATWPAAIRALVVTGFMVMRMPHRGRSFLATALRLSILAVILGFSVEAFAPRLRLAALHIVFITGFALIVMSVATRVVFGHSGHSHLFDRRLPFFIVAGVLAVFAMSSRYVADLAPAARTMHLVAAAICWLVAAAIWGVNVLPKVRLVEPED